MNVLETIQKSIQVIDKLKESDVADYEVYKSLVDGKCCLVGNIAEQIGCDEEQITEWALGEAKPCLIEAFEDKDLAEIIDYNLSALHTEYVNHLNFEKEKKQLETPNDLQYWNVLPKLTFEEMKKEAKKFLKSLLPKGGK